jgi:hypothetical protein
MDNKTIGIVAIVAGIGLFGYTLFRSRTQPYFPPPPKTSRPDEIKNWIDLIISIYGKGKELWEPGGPFHPDSVPVGVDPNLLPKRDDYV